MFSALCSPSSCSPSICFIWPFEHLHNLHSLDTRLLLSLDVGVEKRGGGGGAGLSPTVYLVLKSTIPESDTQINML